jgi:GNAT superfamily N-acetyltransferase
MAAERDTGELPALWFARSSCRPVVLRRVEADDAAVFESFVKALSPMSRQRRFHFPLTVLPPSWLHRLTGPDPATELAMVAIALRDGRPECVAEARYAVGDDGEREFALAVADDWQGQGLGRELLRRLVTHAAARGVRHLFGDVLRDNAPMLRLAQQAGFRLGTHPADARLLRVVQTLELPRDRVPAAPETASGHRARGRLEPMATEPSRAAG